MYKKYLRVLQDCVHFVQKGSAIPVVFFDGIPNVGDLLNPYLIKTLTGREVYRALTNRLPHLRAVGSVLGSASTQSYIWGGGSIDGRPPTRIIDPTKVRALRGRRTLDVVRSAVRVDDLEVPLGDPALLLPRYFMPAEGRGRIRVGLIPHFVDLRQPWILGLASSPGTQIIDVRQGPESFVKQLVGCEMVFSSSLHGLILADAYGIPNKWVQIGPGIIGGSFKFTDYYSVTASPDEKAESLRSSKDWASLLCNAEQLTSVKRFLGDQDELVAAFPQEVLEL